MRYAFLFLLVLLPLARLQAQHALKRADTLHRPVPGNPIDPLPLAIAADSTLPQRIAAFGTTLLGTPYKFGSSSPAAGFDCSGFITYVFTHFGITVPRSSVDFSNEGISIPIDQAQPGDLILFTGTDNKIRTVGHIGIIITNDNNVISFVHSSSGSDNSVIITRLNPYYQGRFVSVRRILY